MVKGGREGVWDFGGGGGELGEVDARVGGVGEAGSDL